MLYVCSLPLLLVKGITLDINLKVILQHIDIVFRVKIGCPAVLFK